jgi:hypothetical protein
MMYQLEIVDLPEGYLVFTYAPPQPTLLETWPEGMRGPVQAVYDLVDPVQLAVGDKIFFVGAREEEAVPPPFRELYQPTESHPPYAVLTVSSESRARVEEEEVGRQQNQPHFIR